jgi:hypothetical protein
MATRTLSPEAREAADQARRAAVEELHQQLADNVGALDNRDDWQRYLSFARSFHNYSFGNRLLIMVQRPDATAVAGYRAWQAKGRQVRRGETAIRVLGPVTRRLPLMDAAGNSKLDDKGEPIYVRKVVGAKPVSVFDLSQTDGPPVPEPPTPVLLGGQAPPGLWNSLAGMVAAEGYRLERGGCEGGYGLTNYLQRLVRVREDIDDAQAVKTLAHELGHVLLPDPSRLDDVADCRGLREVEAESVAFMVTAAHGLDSGRYTFNYVTGWASRASEDLTAEQVVRATGQRVIDTVDKILAHTQPDPNPGESALLALEAQVDLNLSTTNGWEPCNQELSLGVVAERAASWNRDHAPQLGVTRCPARFGATDGQQWVGPATVVVNLPLHCPRTALVDGG